MAQGIVIRLHGKIAVVSCDGREYNCEMRGKLKQGPRQSRSPIAVGDRVVIQPLGNHAGAVEEVLARKGEFCRPSPRNPRVKQVIAANVDALAIVLDASRIDASLPTLDRLLACAFMQNLRPLIVVNKLDLAPQARAGFAPYRELGAEMVFVSALRGDGLDLMRKHLAGKVTAFAGASGAGKSSLLNALAPGLELSVGQVSRDGEGRHTTTHASLLPVADGWVVDTPGVREFGLWGLMLDELSLFYPDFTPWREKCRFSGCTHRHEPGCGVKSAVESGTLDQGRYDRYLDLLRECWNTENRTNR